ncbi:hypothetical protein RUM43_009491 [Polyplax serrata]|uniref:Uncharacterized protein n=1 Tax=Polyplax serrata TaxID=468196 RepID=A0AAN8PWG9_POLSC
MKISVRDWVPESNVKMLRRKSLSLDKSPVNKSERGDRRSSVAAGLLGYKERSPVHLFLDKSSPTEKSVKNERRGSFGGTTPEVKERRGSIVQRYDDICECGLSSSDSLSYSLEQSFDGGGC